MFTPSKAVIRHLNMTIANIDKAFEDPENLHAQTIVDFQQIRDFCVAILRNFRSIEKRS